MGSQDLRPIMNTLLVLVFVCVVSGQEEEDPLAALSTAIPGSPGEDYPIYSSPPETSFVCDGYIEGYYADPEAECQAFHICANFGFEDLTKFSFLCPNGTLFHQKYFICDWWFNVDCSQAEDFYSLNEEVAAAGIEATAGVVEGAGELEGGGMEEGGADGDIFIFARTGTQEEEQTEEDRGPKSYQNFARPEGAGVLPPVAAVPEVRRDPKGLLQFQRFEESEGLLTSYGESREPKIAPRLHEFGESGELSQVDGEPRNPNSVLVLVG